MILPLSVLAVWTVLVTVVIVLRFVRRGDLECFPSLGWLLLAEVPFTVQWGTIAPETRTLQLFGIVFIGACLLLGDVLPVRTTLTDRRSPRTVLPGGSLTAVVLFACIASLHLLLMDKVPLWEKYVHGVRDETALLLMREKASKLLNAPDLLKYVFNWAIVIVVPVGVGLLVNRRSYAAAGMFAAVALLYANITLAKFPTLIMVCAIVMITLGEMTVEARKRAGIAAAFLALLLIVAALRYFLTVPDSVFRYHPPADRVASMRLAAEDPRSVLTIGDRSRLKPRRSNLESTFTAGPLDYVVYRAFLGPTDVSSRWYQYFPVRSGGFLGWEGIAPGTRGPTFVHPAKRVGNWAYRERFPEWYLESIHAYASIDADAYARFGTKGIVAAGLLLLLCRWLLKLLTLDDPLMRSLYAAGLVMLALLPSMASLQAVLLANGLAVVILLMIVVRWFAERRSITPTVERPTESHHCN